MDSWSFLFLIGLGSFLGVAFTFLNSSPWVVLACGIGVTVMGAFFGLDLIAHGKVFRNPDLDALGQSFITFISVLGGALVSCAWTELRAKRREQPKQQNPER